MDYNSRATKLETLSREDLKRAAKILKLKGFSNGNLKSRTAGLRKSKVDDAKTAKQIATEAMASIREAMSIKSKPKLKKQFLTRMKKEMETFEKELDAISSKEPAVAARKTANKSYKDSAEMKQEL